MWDAVISIFKEMWDIFRQYGVIGIYAIVITAVAIVEAKVIWQLLQFLKQYIGRDNAK
jgi:uncharacterized membrane protein YkvI